MSEKQEDKQKITDHESPDWQVRPKKGEAGIMVETLFLLQKPSLPFLKIDF